MKTRMIQLLTAVGTAGFVFGCACNKSAQNSTAPVAGSATSNESPSTVVATVGDTKITLGDLDEHLASQLRDLDEQRYQTRRQGLDQMINQKLVQSEAAKQKVSEEDYLKDQVDAKVKAPSETEIKEFFAHNQAQLPPDAKLEDFRDRIVTYMTQQARSDRAKEVFADLRKNAKVTVQLTPPPKPRVNVEAKGPVRGPENAKITLVEFSDFECPFCGRAHDTVEKVMQKYDGKIKLVFRQFPLSFHQHARKAAEGSLCAAEQGKFWEYYHALFGDQSKLTTDDLKETATKLGMDKAKFTTCLDSGKTAKTIEADLAAGEKAGVSGTPAFFINGVSLSGAQPAEEFERVIEQELATN